MEPRQDGDRALPLPEQIFLRLASLLVPRGRRAQWQREWEGELFELARRGAGRLRVLAFLAGAVPHGMWERKEEWTVDSLMQDFRFAGRTLRRSPGFSLAAVTILALAIGGTTAIYGFLEAAVLRAPPYPAPDRLVMVDIVGTTPAGERTELPWSYPKYRVFAEASPGLDGFAAFARRSLALTGAGQPVQMPVELVTSRYFSLLGTDPVLGRTFTPDEDDPAAAPRVALLSYGLWRSRFGADSTLVGRTVNLNHVPLQVVGVLPPGFDGLTGGARAWVPLASAPAVLRPNALEGAWRHWFRVVGRLPGGLSLEAGRDAVAGAGTALGEAFTLPTGDTEWSVGLEPFAEARVNRTARVSVLVLFGAVLLILLVACANVAGLLLARAADRGRETAVRAALGAGRGRLVRQLLVESLVLSVAGGVLGLGLAWLGTDLLRAVLPRAVGTGGSRSLEFLDPGAVGLHGGVLAFALGLTLVTTLLFGLVPAIRGSRADLREGLKEGRGAVGGRSRGAGGVRGLGTVVVLQVAMALVLLSGAGLMVRSLVEVSRVDLGMEVENLLVVSYELTRTDPAGEEPALFHQRLRERVGALPGVERAGVGSVPPLSGMADVTLVQGVEGRPPFGPEDQLPIGLVYVGPDHFRALGARLVEGREFDAGDGPDGPPVMILGRTAAGMLFPGSGALGEGVRLGVGPFAEEGGRVVGVVEDVRYQGPQEETFPMAFVPMAQVPVRGAVLLVRTRSEPENVAGAVSRVAFELNPSLPLSRVATMDELAAEASARTRVVSVLLTLFAGTALVLAAMGIYGTVAFGVARRVPELGLRMALGASRGGVVGLMLRRGLVLAAVGAVVGLAGAWFSSRLLSALLFRIGPRDPVTLAGTAVLLLAAAALAAWLPARRAAGVDPAEALRAE